MPRTSPNLLHFSSVTSLWKPFLLFLVPLLITNILQSLSGTINTIFVGQMLGVQAVAAVAVFFPILFFLLSFVIGLAAGASVLIGQAWGAREFEKVKQITGNTLAMVIALGLVIALIGASFTQPALGLLGVPPEIMPLAASYSRLMLLGSPLLFIFIVFTSLMRGVGDSFTPMTAMILSIGVGLIVTPAFIKGWFGLPQLGILAPAIATIIGFMVVLTYLFFYMRHKQHALAPDAVLIRHLRLDWQVSKLILRLGLPTALQMVTSSISGIVIIGLVNHYGAQATAAYGAINQVLSYVQFPAMSIAIAGSIFAAQAIGAGKDDALNCVTRTALIMNLVFTGVLITLAYVFSRYLMALFITDPAVIELGQQLLHIVLWSILLFGAGSIFAGIMRASGTVLIPMLINVGCIVLIELPCAVLFSHWYGLKGIWFAYALAFTMMCIIQAAFYQFVWKKKAIQRLI
ncbi:MATE family efflux transporter [Alkanindiges sp. WGS2144]|uniref:MATE family efflux transporter n=1 Tax=Alkanindiges sp. WGS2144 TaxID=3366808 RepID=UPI0037503CC0